MPHSWLRVHGEAFGEGVVLAESVVGCRITAGTAVPHSWLRAGGVVFAGDALEVAEEGFGASLEV